MKVLLAVLIALVAVMGFLLARDVNEDKAREAELAAYKESRATMCDRFAFIAYGQSLIAEQKPLTDQEGKTLRTNAPHLVVMADGCTRVEPMARTIESGDFVSGVLALHQAMESAKAKGWPLVRQTEAR